MKSGRGGKREGAGRKRKRGEPTETVWTRIKQSNHAWLMAESERTGKPTGEILDDAIEMMKSGAKRPSAAQAMQAHLDLIPVAVDSEKTLHDINNKSVGKEHIDSPKPDTGR